MNLFLKTFSEHFTTYLPRSLKRELADYSTNSKILKNLTLLNDVHIDIRLSKNPNTPTDALEHIIISTKKSSLVF